MNVYWLSVAVFAPFSLGAMLRDARNEAELQWYVEDVKCEKASTYPLSYIQPKATLKEMGNMVPAEFHYVAAVVKKDGYYPSILLHGPPGTGKSMMAEGLAKSLVDGCGWKYIRTTGNLVASKYHNGSTVDFKKLVAKIEESGRPTVLAINECGPLFNKVTDTTNDSRASLVDEMKDFLEACNKNKKKVPILVIATTNEYEKIHDAIQSRFGNNSYEIKDPSDADREKIIANRLVKITKDQKANVTRVALIKNLSAFSKTLSIRDIVDSFKKARYFSIGADSSVIKDQHFYHALSMLLYKKMKNY